VQLGDERWLLLKKGVCLLHSLWNLEHGMRLLLLGKRMLLHQRYLLQVLLIVLLHQHLLRRHRRSL
jgi:hypothetical protein